MDLFGSKKNTEDKKSAPEKTAKKKEAVSMQDLYNETAPVVKTASKGKKATATVVNHPAYRILIKPLITEKATNLAAENKYAFVISGKANKIEVAKAIKAVYGIKPIKINIVNVLGKKVRRGKISGTRNNWRKAIVTLPKGETIKIYEGV
jgi:large subunit ribosomal protein L23